jgi:hypothetical protein
MVHPAKTGTVGHILTIITMFLSLKDCCRAKYVLVEISLGAKAPLGRPGNSSQSFLEPEFISEKFLPICMIFDINKILKKYKNIDVTQFFHISVVFRFKKP